MDPLSFLMGLLCPVAVLGVVGLGHAVYYRVRRSTSASEPTTVVLRPLADPPPLPPQDAPVLRQVLGRAAPGRRRRVRGKRPE